MDKLLNSLLHKHDDENIQPEQDEKPISQPVAAPSAPLPPSSQTIDPFAALSQALNSQASTGVEPDVQPAVPQQQTTIEPEPVAAVVSAPAEPLVSQLENFQFSTQPAVASSDATQEFQNLLQILDNDFNPDGIDAANSIGDNLRRTLLFLDANPNMKDILVPEDVQRIVRAMRKSYGGAIVKKTVRKTKRSKVESQANDLVDMLGSGFFS